MQLGADAPRPERGSRIAVIGAGSWGTALALHAARAGHEVALWGHDPEKVAAMKSARENAAYLPGFELHPAIAITDDAASALRDARIVISAVPSRHLRTVWSALGALLPPTADVVSATKGIEEDTGLRMTEVLAAVLPQRPASLSSLSGPSFARELAAEHPTAVTLGCEDEPSAQRVQVALSAGPMRVYRNGDLVGVELGGALKNVIAIAAGIVDGLGLGSNTGAALVCRGLKEVSGLAVAMGAEASTLMGLAGLGDLVLTCTGPLSRNRGVGVEIGQGKTLAEATGGMTMVAEGVVTVRSAWQIATRCGVEMPITEQVHRVLYGNAEPAASIEALLARDLVEEWRD